VEDNHCKEHRGQDCDEHLPNQHRLFKLLCVFGEDVCAEAVDNVGYVDEGDAARLKVAEFVDGLEDDLRRMRLGKGWARMRRAFATEARMVPAIGGESTSGSFSRKVALL